MKPFTHSLRGPATVLALIGVQGRLSAEQKSDLANAGLQAAPGAGAAAGSRLMGLPLSDLLVLASIAFVLLQAGFLVWKWRRDMRREEDYQADRRDRVHKHEDCTGEGDPE